MNSALSACGGPRARPSALRAFTRLTDTVPIEHDRVRRTLGEALSAEFIPP